MADELKKTGLRFEAENVNSYINDVKKASSATSNLTNDIKKSAETFGKLKLPDKFDTQIKKLPSQAEDVVDSLDDMTDSGMDAVDNMDLLLNALMTVEPALIGVATVATAVVGSVAAMTAVVMKATQEYVKLEIEATKSADAFEMLSDVAVRLGKNTGFSETQTREFIDEVRDLNVTAEASANVVAQLAASQLDLSKSAELASVAQDVSALATTSTSDAMEKLNYAIITGHSYTLRSIGINVNFEKSYADMAETLGKTTEQLTDQERMTARLNNVIEYGSRINGAFEESLAHGTRALVEMQTVLDDIKISIGEPFTDAFGTVVKIGYELLTVFRDLVAEGTPFNDFLTSMGVILSVVADALYNFITPFAYVEDKVGDVSGVFEKEPKKWLKEIQGFGEGLGDDLLDIAAKAFEWGGEIIIQLASGMMQAASAVFSQVAQMLGNIFSYWFQPHSPPKFLPDIDVWGAKTMNEYFKGFTEADFSILTDLRSPIKSALQIMSDQEIISKDKANDLYKSLVLDLAKGVKSQDISGVLGDLQSSLGDFGYEISVLAESEFSLVGATNELVAAEKRLEQANQDIINSEAKVNEVMAEFNLAAKEGASSDKLDMMREEYYASLQARKIAEQNAAIAEEEVDVAEDKVDTFQEQVDTQQALLDVLLDLAKEPFSIDIELGGAGVSSGGFAVDSILPSQEEIESSFESLKNRFSHQIARLWIILKAKWNAYVTPYITEIRQTWEQKIKPILTIVEETYNELKENLQPFFDFVSNNETSLTTLLGFLFGLSVVTPIVTDFGLALLFLNGFMEITNSQLEFLTELIPLIKEYATPVANWIRNAFTPIIETLTDAWNTLRDSIMNAVGQVGAFVSKWGELINLKGIGGFIEDIGSFIFGTLNNDNNATGSGGWKYVPPGFGNDSYRVGVSSGERYMVQTRAQAHAFDTAMARMSGFGNSVSNSQTTANYNLNMNTNMEASRVKQGFDLMSSVYGNRVM